MMFFEYYMVYTIIGTTIGLCGCFILLGYWLCNEFKKRKKGIK